MVNAQCTEIWHHSIATNVVTGRVSCFDIISAYICQSDYTEALKRSPPTLELAIQSGNLLPYYAIWPYAICYPLSIVHRPSRTVHMHTVDQQHFAARLGTVIYYRYLLVVSRDWECKLQTRELISDVFTTVGRRTRVQYWYPLCLVLRYVIHLIQYPSNLNYSLHSCAAKL